MPARAKIAGSWKAIAACRVKVGGEWKTVTHILQKDEGLWKEVYTSGTPGPPPPPANSFTVTAAPKTISGSRSGAGNVTSASTTASQVNGEAPISWQWSRVSGATFTINSPTAATTTFTTSLTNGETKSGVYKVVGTDSSVPPKVHEDTVTVNMVSSYVEPPPPPPPNLSLTISPDYAVGVARPGETASTGYSVSVADGSGSYTYNWSVNSPNFVIGSATGPSVTVGGVSASEGERTVQVACSVHDTSGRFGFALGNGKFIWLNY